MRKLWFAMLVLVTLGAAIGCDSGGDDDSGPTDAETFVGNWRLTQLLLVSQGATQDATFLITAAGATVLIDFESSTFEITVETADSTSTFPGTYSVNDTQKTVILTSSEFTAPVTIQYEINSENQITLDTDDVALFVELTGFDLAGVGFQVDAITLVVQRTG